MHMLIHVMPYCMHCVGCCDMTCHAMLNAMLCYAMLCYAMLYAMLCYAMLCYAMLCYVMLCNAMYAMYACDLSFTRTRRVMRIAQTTPLGGATSIRFNGFAALTAINANRKVSVGCNSRAPKKDC